MAIWNDSEQGHREVDAFAQRTLEEAAAASLSRQQAAAAAAEEEGDTSVEVVAVDDNLGAYVTSSMRESLNAAEELPDSQLLESLTELLQDQCRIESTETAASLLQQIAEMVFADRNSMLRGSIITAGVQTNAFTAQQQQPIISPFAAQNLLPGALLEEEEDQGAGPELNEDDLPNTDDETAFPPLGADTDTAPAGSATGTGSRHPPTNKHKKSHKHHHRSSSNESNRTKNSSNANEEASELAAALFRPTTRSRQSSMDETTSSYGDRTLSSAAGPSPSLQPLPIPEQQLQPPDEYQMMQIHHTAELLLGMNVELSPDAAYAASLLASADVNVAQYILEQVLAELPVCRHLLQDGRCYRADCSFSHDLETHTCLFWLKSRCSKGSACRFLHGLAEKWLQDLPEELPQYYDYNHDNGIININNEGIHYHAQQPQYEAFGGADEYGTLYSSSGGSGGGVDYSNLPPPHAPSAYSATSSWIPSPPTSSNVSGHSFANIATQGYSDRQSFVDNSIDATAAFSSWSSSTIPTVKIPQDLWNPHENRDASAFYIADPLERYYTVANAIAVPRSDVIDLHFQSLQTFATVLDVILPEKLETQPRVWIVTGTGHHVGSRTHQKGGGALESAVLDYLMEYYHNNNNDRNFEVKQGRDRNGQGGAVLVERRQPR